MYLLNFGDDKYTGNELTEITVSALSGLGIHNFETIDISTRKNQIRIGFTNGADANIVRAIAGKPQPLNNKMFISRDLMNFILELRGVLTTARNNQVNKEIFI